jgi:beta-galactosidase
MVRLAMILALLTTLAGTAAYAEKEKVMDYPTFVDLQSQTRTTIDLNGEWEFRLDLKDEGVAGAWFQPGVPFGAKINVPGAWQAQGMDAGHCRTGWYRRTVTVPGTMAGRKVWLKIGAVNPSCDVWVNGTNVGSVKQPGVPAKFDVTGKIRPGVDNDIAIRVYEENRGLGNWYNLHDDTKWSGLWRKVELEATGSIRIDDLWIIPDVDRSTAILKVEVANETDATGSFTLKGEVNSSDAKGSVGDATMDISVSGRGTTIVEIKIPVKDVRLWSPQDPHLYSAQVKLEKGAEILDVVADRFGMRKIEVRGTRLYLNDKPLYLRGYGDDGYYPQTFCPETRVAVIREHMRLAKQLGFNYAYSAVIMQPEEYLDAADEVGLLVKYDAGAPLAFQRNGPGSLPQVTPQEKDRLIEEQWRAILKWTQNHPSIFIYSPGGELDPVPMLTRLYQLAKQKDPSRLVLSWAPQTDVFESFVGLGEPVDPSEQLHLILKPDPTHPHIIHEYTGTETLNPYSHESEACAKANGIGDLFPAFIENSIKVAFSTRKLAIEDARKTDFAGYSMWLIQDIPGYPQGLFDYAWRPKGRYATEFIKSNGENALVMNEASSTTRRCFWGGEEAVFEVFVCCGGDRPLSNGKLAWRITDESGAQNLSSGEGPAVNVDPYSRAALPRFTISMPTVKRATAAKLVMTVQGQDAAIGNDWDIWLVPKDTPKLPAGRLAYHGNKDGRAAKVAAAFPAMVPFEQTADVVIADEIDAAMERFLDGGGRVILLGPGNRYTSTTRHNRRTFPPGLDRYPPATVETMFQSRWPNSEMGKHINATIIHHHPLLKDFPHGGYCDYQFYHLIGTGGKGVACNLPRTVTPIIEVFSLWSRAGYMFELKRGNGKLLVTSLDFANTVRQFPESAYLFRLMLDYVAGGNFAPKSSLTEEETRALQPVFHATLEYDAQHGLRVEGPFFAGGGLARHPNGSVLGRECNWVYAASTTGHTMSFEFNVRRLPAKDVSLVIDGGNFPDQREPKRKVRIRVKLNDNTIFDGLNDFPDNSFGQWTHLISRAYFKDGANSLSLSNLDPEGSDAPPYVAVDGLELQATP